jgi:repressor LexA
MNSIAERLEYLITKYNVKHREIHEATGISVGNISSYRSGNMKPSADNIISLAKFFKVSTDWLLTGVGADDPTSLRIPVFGCIRAGVELLNDGIVDSYIEPPEGVKADFACRVIGDSMSFVGIFPGDMAFFRKAETASNGQIIAARKIDIDDEINLKFYIKKNGHCVLRSANPDYSDIEWTQYHRIGGVLVATVRESVPSISDYEQFFHLKNDIDGSWSEIAALASTNGIPANFVKQLLEVQLTMSQKLPTFRNKK